ncbi:MAG: pyridoxal-phosphate dependent enzyme, partial [Chloroflexota bacterium]|nr:pyridoxal-phosphate dependent enzyme [Chloroflexota bacterium]
LEVLIVPVGGGSGCAGACLVAQTVKPSIRVIGVQAEASPAAYESWRQQRLVTAPNATIAEGLATGSAFSLPQQIMRQSLKEFVLIPDAAILQAMLWLIERAHTLVEGAGAASLAAAYRLREELHGKRIGLVCSGGNASLAQLKQALALRSDV